MVWWLDISDREGTDTVINNKYLSIKQCLSCAKRTWQHTKISEDLSIYPGQRTFCPKVGKQQWLNIISYRTVSPRWTSQFNNKLISNVRYVFYKSKNIIQFHLFVQVVSAPLVLVGLRNKSNVIDGLDITVSG